MAIVLMDGFDSYDVIATQERIWGPRPPRVETTVESYYGANRGDPGRNRRQRRADASKARKEAKK